MPNYQTGFFDEEFRTPKLANSLFCHQEFLEKLSEHTRDAIGRRAAFLMQRLSVDPRRLHYKATQGVNRGWRRSRLGGNQGSHFYAWWAPKSAVPLKDAGDFNDVPDGTVFLRDIRHHDDHTPLAAHSFQSHYMPVTVQDLRREEYAPMPWTQPQVRFASARQSVRLLKGHPGSGKTTALWNAADATNAERVLYVTYSSDLASLAREYFDRYCSSHKNFDVITFPNLIRRILGTETAALPHIEARKQFRYDLGPFSRSFGPWSDNITALYDEMHAHLIGAALPVAAGRFHAWKKPRVADNIYKDRRSRFVGQQAAAAVTDLANRLEAGNKGPLADRYFPELALAWQAVEKLLSGSSPAFEYDCIAVDECQDLTPIEAVVITGIASRVKRDRRHGVPLLIAGDEAQTVRPTDFDWGWFCDILHSQAGSPTEYKLAANLRSPHRIAELVNRVWELYSHLDKHDRPGGTSTVEIEDDTSGQILYCSAAPGEELNDLLRNLTEREGLAVVALGDEVPNYVPAELRRSVLTVSEAKGLDFHSVCVLNAGAHLTKIIAARDDFRSPYEIDGLRRRLAIDQLRVALSRPTERLLWLDVEPTDAVVHQSIKFLNGHFVESGAVSSCVPAALLKTLSEDELDPEERVQRCQQDARQFLQVKPEMAWSRAQQAITLLGRPGSLAAVTDREARRTAYLTVAEVCFTLAMRNTHLPEELGRPNLFMEASQASRMAGNEDLAMLIGAVARVHHSTVENRLEALATLAHGLSQTTNIVEPWIRVELASRAESWLSTMEGALTSGHNAELLVKLLPPLYSAFGVPDRESRERRLKERSTQLLLRDKKYTAALEVLQAMPQRQPKLEAACHEGLGDFRTAAACYLEIGDTNGALHCYRSIPDFNAALELIGTMKDHPAAESLMWLSRLRGLVAERPGDFKKIMTTAEKKLLEETLEEALGVARKKPAPRKTAPRKASAKKTAAVKKPAPSTRKRAPKE